MVFSRAKYKTGDHPPCIIYCYATNRIILKPHKPCKPEKPEKEEENMPLKVNPAMIQATANQEAGRSSNRSTDSKFPVFGVPVGEDLLVYIPRIGVTKTENGEQVDWLRSVLHEYTVGNSYGHLRCINGLHEDSFPESGYDGSCPACEAERECWTLAQSKIAAEQKKRGIADDDQSEGWKAEKSKVYSSRVVKGTEKYITFPIVVIPNGDNKLSPAPDWEKNMKVYFVMWKEAMYNERLLTPLEAIPNNPGHPAGMMWLWKYSYTPKSGEQNARDAQRNAKYNAVQNTNNYYNAIIQAAENLAKDFVAFKAAEVVIANQFLSKGELTTFIDKSMMQTRLMIQAFAGNFASSGTTPALSSTASSPEAALANFGATPDEVPKNLGVMPDGAPVAAGNQAFVPPTTPPQNTNTASEGSNSTEILNPVTFT